MARGFRQTGVSSIHRKLVMLTVSSVGQAGLYIFERQVLEFRDNFVGCHARREIIQHVVNRNAQPAYTGFAATFPRLDGDEFFVVHTRLLQDRAGLSGYSGDKSNFHLFAKLLRGSRSASPNCKQYEIVRWWESVLSGSR